MPRSRGRKTRLPRDHDPANLIHDMPKLTLPPLAGDWTLRQALDEYLKAHPNLKPRSVAQYRYMITHYLTGWLDLPMRSITEEMVKKRHRAIQAEVQARAAAKHRPPGDDQ